jgi:quercetin dioxygenase-like cupin family protein
MKLLYVPGIALTLLAADASAADEIKSGPQPGQFVGPPFNPLHATGPDEGKRVDLVEKNGANPVAIIFAREVNGPLVSLIKKIDEATGMNRDSHLASFVVFCSDDDGMDNRLKDLAAKEKLKNTILTVLEPSGPRGYRIAADADVTVVLYSRKMVKANKAFRKGELTEADVEKVLFELDTILPEKKGEAMDLAVYAPTDLKWTDAPAILPRGAKVAILEGDPTKEGPFVMRVKLPDGYKIPPHTHPKPERLTVISGTVYIGMGAKFDPDKGREMPTGTFGTWPAGMKHFVWAKGETIIQLHGTGPWTLTYVKPEDDPRTGRR